MFRARSGGETGALELMNAYAKIPDTDPRKALVHLAKTVAKKATNESPPG
jgi:hypothetical protein